MRLLKTSLVVAGCLAVSALAACSSKDSPNTPQSDAPTAPTAPTAPEQKAAIKITDVRATTYAFSALRDDGSVVVWGSLNDSSFEKAKAQLSSGVVQVVSSRDAFAALKNDGSVVTWGPSWARGSVNDVARDLAGGVKSVYAIDNGFAALKDDGTIVSWGAVADSLSTNFKQVQTDLRDVVAVVSGDSVFGAVRKDGSLVVWGFCGYSCKSTVPTSIDSTNIAQFVPNYSSYAAIQTDGSVVTWGTPEAGGDSSSVAVKLSAGVKKVIAVKDGLSSKSGGFAALKHGGDVVAWGSWNYQECGPELLSDAKDIAVVSGRHLAILKTNGTVSVCGRGDASTDVVRFVQLPLGTFVEKADGSVTPLYSVSALPTSAAISNAVKFSDYEAFLNTSGSVVAWYPMNPKATNPMINEINGRLASGVAQIYSNSQAFVALLSDGTIQAWGTRENGGDPNYLDAH